MSISSEAKAFVAHIRDANLMAEMPQEFMALADAVDEDEAVGRDIIMDQSQPAMICPRCGKSEVFPIPCDVTALIHWFSYFRYAHARCMKP